MNVNGAPDVNVTSIDETLYDSRPAGYGTEASRSGHMVKHKNTYGTWRLDTEPGMEEDSSYYAHFFFGLKNVPDFSSWELRAIDGSQSWWQDTPGLCDTIAMTFDFMTALQVGLELILYAQGSEDLYEIMRLSLVEAENPEDPTIEVAPLEPMSQTSCSIVDAPDGEGKEVRLLTHGGLFKFDLNSVLNPDLVIYKAELVLEVAQRSYDSSRKRWVGTTINCRCGADLNFESKMDENGQITAVDWNKFSAQTYSIPKSSRTVSNIDGKTETYVVPYSELPVIVLPRQLPYYNNGVITFCLNTSTEKAQAVKATLNVYLMNISSSFTDGEVIA